MSDSTVLISGLGVPDLDRDNARSVLEREFSIQSIHYRREDRANRDGDGDRETTYEGDTHVLEQHPCAQPSIERHAREPREGATFSHLKSVSLDPAEGHRRSPSGLIIV